MNHNINQYQEIVNDAQTMTFEQLGVKYDMNENEVEALLIDLKNQGYQPQGQAQTQPAPQPEPEPGMIQQVVPQIIQTLQKDEQARRDLIKYVNRSMGFDISPYLDNVLKTTTKAKYLDTSSMREPAADIARTVLEMYFEDGYDMYQIAEQTHLKISIIKSMIQNKDHWMTIAKKKAVAVATKEVGIEPMQLPWIVRQYLKIRGWF